MKTNDSGISNTKLIQAACLRLLALRDHSRKELLNKLLPKGFAKPDILAVIDELAEQGWQNDQRYAESYARSRIQKGYGPIRVAYELQQNGIGFLDLGPVLNGLDTDWVELIGQVYRKKYKNGAVTDRNEWAKRSRFLLQRGFPGELVSALYDQLLLTNQKFSFKQHSYENND